MASDDTCTESDSLHYLYQLPNRIRIPVWRYHSSVISKICSWAMNISDSKKGCVGVFSSCDISLKNTPTSHAVGLALVICACRDSAKPLLSCTCLCSNINGACCGGGGGVAASLVLLA